MIGRKYSDCIRLNLRVAGLALARRWIHNRDVEKSYDQLSADYGESWLEHLRPVTHDLLAQLPGSISGPILDLGCGTGETIMQLAERYPFAAIQAQDISSGMLQAARRRIGDHPATFCRGDMFAFLQEQLAESAELIVSAWAIGYSRPALVLKEAARVLRPGGRFAFVVNLLDTLKPVNIAFRKTMQRYPEKLKAVSRPQFPRSWRQLERQAQFAGLATEWNQEGRIAICGADEASLPWLLNTGILAGFDAMLPLRSDAVVADYFEQCLQEQLAPLEHRYIMAILRKHE